MPQFPRVKTGDAFHPSASFHNATAEMLEEYRSDELPTAFGLGGKLPYGFVSLQNGGTDDLPLFSVVAVGNLLTPTDDVEHARPAVYELKLLKAVTDPDPVLAVLQQEGGKEKDAPAMVRGITPLKVEVKSAHHTHAMPDPADTNRKIVSSPAGPFRLLWKPEGTGADKWCVALVGGEDAPERLYIATGDEASGKVKLKCLKSDGTPEDDEIEDVPTFAPEQASLKHLKRPIRTNDICSLISSPLGDTVAWPVRGAADALKEIPAGTGAEPETTEWKIEDQPEGKRGVHVKKWSRLYHSGVIGTPLYEFTREEKKDSKGNTIYVGPEVRSEVFGTGPCAEE